MADGLIYGQGQKECVLSVNVSWQGRRRKSTIIIFDRKGGDAYLKLPVMDKLEKYPTGKGMMSV